MTLRRADTRLVRRLAGRGVATGRRILLPRRLRRAMIGDGGGGRRRVRRDLMVDVGRGGIDMSEDGETIMMMMPIT